MTGYDEAVEWLRANAPDWRLTGAESTLRAGPIVGAPTETDVRVELVEADAYMKQKLGGGYVTLVGSGRTIREAVERAVGGLRDG